MPIIRWPNGTETMCPHGSDEGKWSKICDCVETIEDTYELAEAHKTVWRYRDREVRANG
jgi:hypothetical protein